MILRLLELPIAFIATLGSRKAGKICKAINRHRISSLKHYYYFYAQENEREFNPVTEEVRDIKIKIGMVFILICFCIFYWVLGQLFGLTEPILY